MDKDQSGEYKFFNQVIIKLSPKNLQILSYKLVNY